MSESYHLFEENTDRLPTWVETVDGLSHVKERLVQLTERTPGRYLIWDQTRTGFVEPFKRPA